MGVQSSKMSHYRGIEGLGGWLAILQIIFYVSIGSLLLQLLISYSTMNGELWPLFASETSEHYVPEWRNAVRYEVWSSLFHLGFLLYVLIMFYGKKRFLPKIMMVYFPVVLLLNVGHLYFLNQAEIALGLVNLPETLAVLPSQSDKHHVIRALVRSVVGCAVWIPYFLKSDRVENTFVR